MITMDPKAHYVTQTGVFTSIRLGPLTDRRIRFYEKRGYYGAAAQKRALERERVKQRKILAEFVA